MTKFWIKYSLYFCCTDSAGKREESEQVAQQIKEYLARGGIIQQIPFGVITDRKDKFMNPFSDPQFPDV